MSFRRVIAQDHVVNYFYHIISRGRLAHAYILYGPKGVGKALFARELTKTLFCGEKGKEACDLCGPCKKVDSGTHPDLYWVAPLEGKRAIGIKQIEELEVKAFLKPFEAERRVFILEEADKMTEQASNCLLKTLEEPPPATLFLLTTASLSSLHRTILSRCQTVRFHPLPTEVLKGLLNERGNLERCKGLIKLSCGSMGRITELVEEKIGEHRSRFLEILLELRPENNFSITHELLEWCPVARGLEGHEVLEGRRALLRIWLDLLLAYYRDILLYKIYSEERRGACEPMSDGLEPFYEEVMPLLKARARALSTETILNILEEIVTAMEGLNANANLNLLLDNLFLRLARYEAR